jgi:hypothetical protein
MLRHQPSPGGDVEDSTAARSKRNWLFYHSTASLFEAMCSVPAHVIMRKTVSFLQTSRPRCITRKQYVVYTSSLQTAAAAAFIARAACMQSERPQRLSTHRNHSTMGCILEVCSIASKERVCSASDSVMLHKRDSMPSTHTEGCHLVKPKFLRRL